MLTHSVTLYLSAVLIWGSTFFAIKFQLGEVPPELSVAYRFAIASLLLFGWILFRKLPLRFSLQQHLWMGLQGLFLFCLNYLVIYWATSSLTSGLIAVIFSTIVLMNIVNSIVFLRKTASLLMIFGAVMGLAGIALIFAPELINFNSNNNSLTGVGLSLLGTFIASLGNIISAHNQRQKIPVIQTNAYGMAYGAIILLVAALLQGYPLSFDFSLGYSLSLMYLALFGSVLAFGSYLTLLGRIGPEKAAYTMVLFPLVALGISTIFENYQWTLSSVMGVALVLLGNVIIILPKGLFRGIMLHSKS
ncbi:MAG: EamA family transporter [Proteobacteria bacterium]|nr:EamA family transporter [Pseudomonadota bacterium]